jgi:hypothetical protein
VSGNAGGPEIGSSLVIGPGAGEVTLEGTPCKTTLPLLLVVGEVAEAGTP